jgi:hypothetical protein
MSDEVLPRISQTIALYELGGGNVMQNNNNLSHVKEGIGLTFM